MKSIDWRKPHMRCKSDRRAYTYMRGLEIGRHHRATGQNDPHPELYTYPRHYSQGYQRGIEGG